MQTNLESLLLDILVDMNIYNPIQVLRYWFFSAYLIMAVSCKLMPHSDKVAAEIDRTRVYRLLLNPAADSKYPYEISTRSEYNFEVEGRKMDNLTKVNAAVVYNISKDSTGDFVIHIQYDKLHVYSKNGDSESDLDAANAANSGDPVEILLGGLKEANIVAKVSPAGEVRSVSGFREIYNKYVNPLPAANTYQLTPAIKQRWDNLVGEQLINKNMEQLFRIFPDSAVHIGDKWQLSSKEKGDIVLNTATSFTLTGIQDQTAFLESEGQLSSDSVTQFMGNTVTTDLKGKQKGEYQVDTKTGMMLSATVSVTAEGTLQVMGRDVPLTINSQVKIERIKMARN
jgi:hypothetical protein